VNMNPRCLKETISPGCGFHLFANSVVPAGATNRTPFGLLLNKEKLEGNRTKEATYNSHSHEMRLVLATTFASASRYFWCALINRLSSLWCEKSIILPCVWGIHLISQVCKEWKDLARWFLLLLDPWYPEISSQDDLFLHTKYMVQLKCIGGSSLSMIALFGIVS